MTDTLLMSCGHAANATMKTPDGDIPACAICFNTEPREDQRILAGRLMQCVYFDRNTTHGRCTAGPRPSDPDKVAFFEYRPNADHDLYYCGCWGWD